MFVILITIYAASCHFHAKVLRRHVTADAECHCVQHDYRDYAGDVAWGQRGCRRLIWRSRLFILSHIDYCALLRRPRAEQVTTQDIST